MLASKNLPQPITKATQGYHWIRVLAAELALRLNEAREANTALWPKTIVLHIRQGIVSVVTPECARDVLHTLYAVLIRPPAGYETSKSKQTPFPFTKNVTVDVIAAYGDKLWKELVGPGGSTPFNVTNVQLSFSGIGIMETGQRSIEGFLAARRAIEEQTVTQTEAAEGSTSKPPSALKRKRSASPTKEPRQSDLQDEAVSSARPSAINERDEQFSFVCERCGQRVWLGDADAARDVDADGRQEHAGAFDAIREEALAALRLEHADFHFAQELAASADENVPKRVIRPVDRPAPAAKKKKSKKKSGEEGIAKFFSKR